MGELSAALEKNVGGRPQKTLPIGGYSLDNAPTKTAILAEAGISQSVAQRAEELAAAPDDIKQALFDGTISLTQAARTQRAERITKAVSLMQVSRRWCGCRACSAYTVPTLFFSATAMLSTINCNLLIIWCPGPELNRYRDFSPRDFKSLVSTNFTTRAEWSKAGMRQAAGLTRSGALYRVPLKIQSSLKCKARKTKFQCRVTFRLAGTKIWIFRGALQRYTPRWRERGACG